jgi:hypothetical protein
MYAIRTRYVGPTNHKPSHIVATAGRPAKHVSVSYDSADSDTDAHIAARNAWIKKHATGEHAAHKIVGSHWVMGELPDGSIAHCLHIPRDSY